jgi:hypothetical protein
MRIWLLNGLFIVTLIVIAVVQKALLSWLSGRFAWVSRNSDWLQFIAWFASLFVVYIWMATRFGVETNPAWTK